MRQGPSDVTACLMRLRNGDQAASGALLALVYDELHDMAAAFFRHERAGHTLQPTALVHEAYLKLVQRDSADFFDKSHFLAAAAQAIRRILIDHARRHGAAKRRPPTRVTIHIESDDAAARDADLEALDNALTQLARLNARQARIVEMRFFAGMTIEETAAALDVSANTVKGDWRVARAWLQQALEREGFA